MARKKIATAADTATQSEESIPGTAQGIHDDAQDQPVNNEPELIDAPAEMKKADDGKTPRFIRDTFSSPAAGVKAGEDKRFNLPQVFIDFDDDKRATAEEKADLGQAGFRYRPKDKGYSALANADTRQARDELALKFTDRRLKEKKERGEGNER